MNKNAVPHEQLRLFRETFPETNPCVVPPELAAEVCEILALLFLQLHSQERVHIANGDEPCPVKSRPNI
jgi:hypothetical protein